MLDALVIFRPFWWLLGVLMVRVGESWFLVVRNWVVEMKTLGRR